MADQQVMEEGVSNYPAKNTRRRKRVRSASGIRKESRCGYKRRSKTRDLAFSLEHILTAGYQLEQDTERRKEFRRLQEARLEQQHCQPWVYFPENENSDRDEDVDDYNNNAKGGTVSCQRFNDDQRSIGESSSKIGARRKQVLQEDIRIYGEVGVGKEGFAKPPWPKQRKNNRFLNNSDKNWETEHGDSIHPLAFAATRLSEKPISNSVAQEGSLNGGNLNVSTTDTSLQEDEVPRALLLRCWERAVHASSQSIPVRVSRETHVDPQVSTTQGQLPATNVRQSESEGLGATSTTLFGNNLLGLGDTPTMHDAPIIPQPLPPVNEPKFLAYQRNMARDRRATEAKCISLGIGIPRTIPSLTCPICFQTFKTSKIVRDHYYGGGDQRGCCWRRIAEKQPDVIAQVLETHVKSQINEFLGLVMENASERIIAPVDSQTKGKRRRLMNWHDILKFAEKTIHTSHLITVNNDSSMDPPHGVTHPVLETLQRKSNSFPLCLNPTVLETVRQRLVDRYAKLPL